MLQQQPIRTSMVSLCFFLLVAAAAPSFTLASSSSSVSSPGTEILQQKVLQAQHRTLQQQQENDDFDAFRDLLKGLVIQLPDFEASQPVVFFDLVLRATNVKCFDVYLGSTVLDHTLAASNDELTFALDLVNLDLVCTLDYEFEAGFLQGDGSAKITLNDNTAGAQISFTSAPGQTFAEAPPSNATMEDCTTDISITDMEFSGGNLDTILDAFEGLLRGVVEGEAGDAICDELGTLGTTLEEDLLVVINDFLVPHLLVVESSTLVDPSRVAEERMLTELAGSGVTLMSFQEDSDNSDEIFSSVPGIINMALNEVRAALGGEELGINAILQDNILEADRSFTLDMKDLPFGLDLDPVIFEGHDNLTETKITMTSLKVFGLDTFTHFEPLVVSSTGYTLQNEMKMEYLRFEVNVVLDIKPSTLEDSMIQDLSDDVGIVENVQIKFGIDDIAANLSVLLAIDQDKFNSLAIGPLLFDTNLLSCLMTSVFNDNAQVSDLAVSVGNLQEPTLDGFISKGIDDLVTKSVEGIFLMYESAVLRALPSIFQTTVKDLINDSLFGLNNTDGDSVACPAPKQMDGLVDFRDLLLDADTSRTLGGSGQEPYGSIVSTLVTFLKSQIATVDEMTGKVAVNNELLTMALGGVSEDSNNLYFPGELLGDDIRITFGGLDAGIAFSLSDARIGNLNSFGTPFSILDPVRGERSLLNNTATIGVSEPLRLGARLFLNIETGGEVIKNDFELSADMHSASLVLTALIKMAESRFSAFPLGDLLNLDCWMATVLPPSLDEFGIRMEGVDATAGLDEFMLTMKQINMNLTCVECTSPVLQNMAELWSSPEVSVEMTDIFNEAVSYLGSVLGDGFLQIEVDRRLNDAAKRCPHSPQYQEGFTSIQYAPLETNTESDGTSLAVMLMIVIACLVGVAGCVVLAVKLFVRRRHGKWLASLPYEQILALKQRQEKEQEKDSEMNAMTKSLFCSPEIPLFVRWIIPLIIVGNVAFFLSGHLSLAAEVTIVASVAGQTLTVDQFYQFSMVQSTVEIWNAGGKELASLILIFSGIWPYTKQFITMVLWFIPPTRCSISTRGSILLWLDTLAKWSIVDIFTLVMSICAFRLSIESPEVGFLPNRFYSLDFMVVPMWGLYANLIAQLISQVSSHFIIHYHRNVEHQALIEYRHNHGIMPEKAETLEEAVLSYNPYGDREDRLCKRTFARPHRGESEKLTVRRFINPLLVFGAIALCICIVVGVSLPSVGLDFLGLLGVAVEFGQGGDEATASLSLFDVTTSLMDQARFTGDAKSFAGLGSLSALVVITVLIVPLVQTATLLYHWFAPMTGKTRSRLSVLVESLSAWQYAEVYIASVIVASWQLGPISMYMINSYCGSLQETFDLMAFLGVIAEEDAQCFRVNPTIKEGAYILAVGAVLLALFNSFVMNAVVQYFRDRDEEYEQVYGGLKKASDFGELELGSPATMKDSFDRSSDGMSLDEQSPPVEDDDERNQAMESIRPTPVLFTDKYRWTLCGANSSASFRSYENQR